MHAARVGRLIAMATIIMAIAAPGSSNAEETCANPYVKILQPSGGQVIVNGPIASVPGGQSFTLSTTGTIDVVIEHGCAVEVDLVVTKTAPGAPAVVHQNHWAPLDCATGKLTDVVTIGLDGGSYQFDVNGMACTGRKLRSDGHGGTIVDPPLPVVRLETN